MDYVKVYAESLIAEMQSKQLADEQEKQRIINEVLDQLQEPYQQAIRNINQSNQLRSEINKALEAGVPLKEVLNKSLLCISLMTGDNLFYTANIKRLEGEQYATSHSNR